MVALLTGTGNKTEQDCLALEGTAIVNHKSGACMNISECEKAYGADVNSYLTPESDYQRCEAYKSGDLNPYGLRIIEYDSGVQIDAPVIKVIPQAMEYDVLSMSILCLVTWYPTHNPTMTDDEYDEPVLSLVAINETTGEIFDCVGGTTGCHDAVATYQQSVTFCKQCGKGPAELARDWIEYAPATAEEAASFPGGFKILREDLEFQLELKYDYTQVSQGSTAFDSLSQVFFCVLNNPHYDGSETLFSIQRLSILVGDEDKDNQSPYYWTGPNIQCSRDEATGEFTDDCPQRTSDAKQGIWIVELQWTTFHHWRWPPHLIRATSLEFGPKQVERIDPNVEAYQPVEGPADADHLPDDEKTLFSTCSVKQGGACVNMKCGHYLTAADIEQYGGQYPEGYECSCTVAVMQINVDVESSYVHDPVEYNNGEMASAGNTNNFRDRWTGIRDDYTALTQEYAEVAVLDSRIAGFEASQNEMKASSPAPAAAAEVRRRLSSTSRNSSRKDLDYVPVALIGKEGYNPLDGTGGDRTSIFEYGRQLLQTTEEEGSEDEAYTQDFDAGPFSSLLHGVGAFLSPFKEQYRPPLLFFVDYAEPTAARETSGSISSNDAGSHVLHSFGIGGQRQRWMDSEGNWVDWLDSEYANCYTASYCTWLSQYNLDVYVLESVYESEDTKHSTFDFLFENQADYEWSQRFLCLEENRCRLANKNDNTVGFEIIKQRQLDSFPIFMWNSGQDSKATETKKRNIYPFPTQGRYSYMYKSPYYVKGYLQSPYEGIDATAGSEGSFTLQAIDKLGFPQTNGDDVFSVTIYGSFFPATCSDDRGYQTCRDDNTVSGVCQTCLTYDDPDFQCVPYQTTQNCPDSERIADPVGNPAVMPWSDIRLGPVYLDTSKAGGYKSSAEYSLNNETAYFEAEFPNVHDEKYTSTFADFITPDPIDAACNDENGDTDPERSATRNKCVRRLVRPVFLYGTDGQYDVKFRLDLAGSYQVRVTHMGSASEISQSTSLDIGTEVQGSRYTIIVSPATAKAQWSTATGYGLYNTTVGEQGSFTIAARDRFGNAALYTDDTTLIDVGMNAGVANAVCGYPPSVDADGLSLVNNNRSICYGSCLADETIINPTDLERAECEADTANCHIDWVSYCAVSNNDDGTYTTEYYLTQKRKGDTWYSTSINLNRKEIYGSPFETFAGQRESYARECFGSNKMGEEHGMTSAAAGTVTVVEIQAKDYFSNSQNQGGDPFYANVTDELGRVAVDQAVDTRDCTSAQRRSLLGTWKEVTDDTLEQFGDHSYNSSGVRRLVLQTDDSDDTETSSFQEPSLTISYQSDGKYKVEYTVFKAGEATLSVLLTACDDSLGPQHIGTTSPASPFKIMVSSAVTWVGMCSVVEGESEAVDSFVAAAAYGQYQAGVPYMVLVVTAKVYLIYRQGVSMMLQLRDKYSNDRDTVEDLYLSEDGIWWPEVQFQYNIDPTSELITETSLSYVAYRDYDQFLADAYPENAEYLSNTVVKEIPTNTDIYNGANGVITLNPTVQYVQDSGRFKITWTSTLAGSYDVAILMRQLTDDAEGWARPRRQGVCAYPCTVTCVWLTSYAEDCGGVTDVGMATLDDTYNGVVYNKPFAVKVMPDVPDVRMFELMYWMESESGATAFYSSLQSTTHDFVDDLDNPLSPSGTQVFQIEGVAGIMSTFAIQARDTYGNVWQGSLMEDTDFSGLAVSLIEKETDIEYPFVYVPLGTEAEWTEDVVGGTATELGQGFFFVKYLLDKTGMFDVKVTLGGSTNLKTIVDQNTDTKTTMGYTTWNFGTLYTVSVGSAPTSAIYCQASGNGLSGGVREEEKTVTIIARDQFGNQKESSDEVDLFSFVLWVDGNGPIAETNDNVVISSVSGTGQGQYSLTWTPITVGSYRIEVKYDGITIGGASSAQFSEDDQVSGVEQEELTYEAPFAYTEDFKGGPVTNGQYKFMPIYVEITSAMSDPEPKKSQAYAAISDGFGGYEILSDRYTGGRVGEVQIIALKPFSAQNFEITNLAEEAFGYINVQFFDSSSGVDVAVANITQTAQMIGASCERTAHPNLQWDSVLQAYIVELSADNRPAIETSPTLAGKDYVMMNSTISKAQDYKVFIEAIGYTLCDDRSGLGTLFGYDDASTPYYGLVSFEPGSSNKDTALVLDGTGSSSVEDAPEMPQLGSGGIMQMEAGATVSALIQSLDKFDNPAKWSLSAADNYEVTLKQLFGQKTTYTIQVVDLQNGFYNATFQQTMKGRFNLYIKVEASSSSEMLSVSNQMQFNLTQDEESLYYLLLEVTAGPRDVQSCTAAGKGITQNDTIRVAESTPLEILEKDEYGNERDSITLDADGNPSIFSIHFAPADEGSMNEEAFEKYSFYNAYNPTDLNTGTHRINYLPGCNPDNLQTDGAYAGQYYPPPLASDFKVSITVGDVHIAGSPYSMTFAPGELDLDTTEVYGPGLVFDNLNPETTGGTVRAGVTIDVTVQGKDAYGNKLTSGGDDIKLVLATFPPDYAGKPTIGTVVDFGNGTYLAQYSATHNAQMLLQVSRGPYVPTSNYKLQKVSYGEVEPRPGEDYYLGTGGTIYEKHIIDYVPATGEDELDGVKVKILPGPLNNSFTELKGDVVKGWTNTEDEGCVCTLGHDQETRTDKCGLMEAGGSLDSNNEPTGFLAVSITRKDLFRQPKNDLDDNRILMLRLEYWADQECALPDESKPPSYSGTVNGVGEVDTSSDWKWSGADGNDRDGEEIDLCFDEESYGPISNYTNHVTPDYTSVEEEIGGQGLELSLRNEFSEGRFTINFTVDGQLPALPPYESLYYRLTVRLNNAPLGGSPFTLRVLPGPVYGPMSEVSTELTGKHVVNEYSTFLITAKDEYGNNQTTSDQVENWVVNFQLVSESITGMDLQTRGCTSNVDSSDMPCAFNIEVTGEEGTTTGCYNVTFKTTESSTFRQPYHVMVRFCEFLKYCDSASNLYNPYQTAVYEPRHGYEEFDVVVEPGNASASRCTAVGADLTEGGLVNKESRFYIEARDEFTNQRTKGGDEFTVLIYQPESKGVMDGIYPADLNNGTYLVTFTPPHDGLYSIIIMLDFHPIEGSPFDPIYRDADSTVDHKYTTFVTEFGVTDIGTMVGTAGEGHTMFVQTYSSPDTHGIAHGKRTGGDTVWYYPKSHELWQEDCKFCITAQGSGFALGANQSLATDLQEYDLSKAGMYNFSMSGDLFTRAGNYRVEVRVCECTNADGPECPYCSFSKAQVIKNSPWSITVQPATPDPETSVAVELVNPERTVNVWWFAGADDALTFSIQSNDKYGNHQQFDFYSAYEVKVNVTMVGRTNGEKFTQTYYDSNRELLDGEYMVELDYDSGLYLVSLRAEYAQLLDIDVLFNDVPIDSGRDYWARVSPNTIDVSNCVVEGNAVGGPVGNYHRLKIRTRDAFNNDLTDDGAQFYAVLTMAEEFVEEGSGNNPLSAQVKYRLPGTTPDPFDYTGAFHFLSDGKTVEMGFKDIEFMNNTGTYILEYTSQRAGPATMHIYADVTTSYGISTIEVATTICTSTSALEICRLNADVADSGYINLHFDAEQPAPSECIASSDYGNMEIANAGYETTFQIMAYDKFRNAQTNDGYAFTVTLTNLLDGRRILGSAEYSRDGGKYEGSYTVAVAGSYTLSVKRNSEELMLVYLEELYTGPIGVNTDPLLVEAGQTTGETTVVEHEYMTAAELNKLDQPPDKLYAVATAGTEQNFLITAYDAFGNQLSAGGEQFLVQVGLFDEGQVLDNGDGSYDASYLMYVAGDYNLQIYVNQLLVVNDITGRIYDIQTSSFPLVVMGTDVHPDLCTVAGSGLSFAVAGEEAEFIVTAVDEFGNAKISGGDTFGALIYGLQNVTLDGHDNGNGQYSFKYTLSTSGKYQILVNYNGTVFYTHPSFTQVESASISLDSYAVGEGITVLDDFKVNQLHTFQIFLKDNFLNNITQGDQVSFAVDIITGSGTILDFSKLTFAGELNELSFPPATWTASEQLAYEDENPYQMLPVISYECEYQTGTSGEYVISITYLSRHLAGSPYSLMVETSITGAGDNCQVRGNGCTYAEGLAIMEGIMSPTDDYVPENPIASFKIYTRDIYGNDKFTGNDTFAVLITRPNLITYGTDSGRVTVEDHGDGSYTLSYSYIQAGVHKLEVDLLRNSDGDLCNYNGDTSCSVGNTPSNPDVKRITAAALRPPSASASFVYGVAVEGSVAGELSTFYIKARKETVVSDGVTYNNVSLITGGDIFEISIELDREATLESFGFNTSDVEVDLADSIFTIDNAEGTYVAQYTATSSGIYQINVTYNGLSLAFSDSSMPTTSLDPLSNPVRYMKVFPAVSSPNSSFCEGIPMQNGSEPSAGVKSTFLIVARDRYGNRQETKDFQLSPDTFELYIQPSDVGGPTLLSSDQTSLDKSITLFNNDDGTYTAGFTPYKRGMYDFVILLDREPIIGVPYVQLVVAGIIDAKYAQVYAIGGGPINDAIDLAQAMGEFQFIVQAADQYGNNLTSGGTPDLIYGFMERESTREQYESSVQDFGDGTYLLTIVPEVTGSYILTVIINGGTVLPSTDATATGSGFIKQVVTYAPNCQMQGTGATTADAGAEASFLIQARDKNDLLKQAGGDLFKVEVIPRSLTNEYGQPLEGFSLTPIDQSRLFNDPDATAGYYDVSYTLQNFGEFNVSITLKGEHIKGSPFHLVVSKALPPVPSLGRFSNTATKITIYWEDVFAQPMATNRAGMIGLDLCSKVFTEASVAVLGEGPVCSFPEDDRLEIFLGYDASVEPNDQLSLLANAVLSKAKNSQGASGTIIVEKPFSAPVPKVVLRGPVYLGICDDFLLDASGSYGAAGRQLHFQYGVYPNVPNEDTLSTLLDDYSKTLTHTAVFVSGDLMQTGYTYKFAVRVYNFLGEMTLRYHEVTRRSWAIPNLLVQGDPVLTTFRNQGLFAKADIAVPQDGPPECSVPSPDMRYRWSSNENEPDNNQFRFDPQTRYSKNMYIPPFTLTAGLTYYIEVEGEIDGAPELYNKALAQVYCRYSSLDLSVQTPMQVMPADGITIDTTNSFDPDDPSPDNPEYPFGKFQVYFSCYNVSTDGITPEVPPYDKCFNDEMGLMYPDPEEGVLILPPDTLAPGRYRFDVSISKEPLYAPESGEPLDRSALITKYVQVKDPNRRTLMSTLALDVNFTSYEEDPLAFEDAFVLDMGTILGVTDAHHRIAVVSAIDGSVNMTFLVYPPEDGDDESKSTNQIVEDVNGVGVTLQFDNLEFLLETGVAALNPLYMQDYDATLLTGMPPPPPVVSNVEETDVMPILLINKLPSNIVNANEKLPIGATLRNFSLYKNQTTFHWEVMEGVLNLDMYPEELHTPRNNSNLVIRKNVLAAGQSYTLRLYATNMFSGLQAFDEVSFIVNGAPSSGTCTIFPFVGYAAETKITLTCSSWEDDGTDPVEFEFRYYDPTSSEPVPLVSRSRSNEVELLIPPVTLYPSFEIILTAYIVDFYNAKAQVNKTIVVYPPNTDPDAMLEIDCASSNYTLAEQCECDATGDTCTGTYNITGSYVFTQALVERELRTAQGTNNVPALLTLAKCVSKINNDAQEEVDAKVYPVQPVGALPDPVVESEIAQDDLNSAQGSLQLSTVLNALKTAIETVKVTKEELDQFGEVYRESTKGTGSLKSGNNTQEAQNSVLSLADSSGESGLDGVAAQGLLDSAGGIVDASDTGEEDAEDARDDLLTQGGAEESEEDAAATEARNAAAAESSAAVNGIVSKLSKSGLNGGLEGEDPFAVSSNNLQMASKVSSDPSGPMVPPSAPGVNASSAPSFDVPPGVGAPAEDGASVDVVSSVNNKNPHGYANDSSKVTGNVASFGIKNHGSEAENEIANLSTPVQIKIPVTVSGSTCRKTSGGCRYWDEAAEGWSTEGMYEKERTDEYILCEAIHLSTFAVSADDVVPAFNLPDPTAPNFANMSLDSALAIFVVAFILALYGVANFTGYKKDVRDRHKKRLAEKIATVDSRLSASKGLNITADGDIIPPEKAAGGALSKPQLKKKQSKGEQMATALKAEHNVVSIITVTAEDSFTRPQRLTVLLCIVLGQIAVSAVFFGLEPGNVAMKAIIGAVTAIMLIPPKVIFKMLFQKSTFRKPPKKDSAGKEARTRKREAKAMAVTKKIDSLRGSQQLERESRAGADGESLQDSDSFYSEPSTPVSGMMTPLGHPPGHPLGRPKRRVPRDTAPLASGAWDDFEEESRAGSPTSSLGSSEMGRKRSKSRTRPGAGRSQRPKAYLQGPRQELVQSVVQVSQEKHTASTTEMGQELVVHSLFGADGGATQPRMDLYVPEAIVQCAVKIQNAWRRQALVRARRRNKAILLLQRTWRGHVARKELEEEKLARAVGRPVQGLWWVSAHMHKTPLAAATADKGESAQAAGSGEAVDKWVGGDAKGGSDQKLTTTEREKKEKEAKEKEARQRRRRRAKQRGKLGSAASKRKGLPRWFIYVAYIGAFAWCMASAWYIIIYGLFFEPPVARAWLLSSIFSLMMDFFVMDPVKIAAVGVVKARLMTELIEFKKRRLAASSKTRGTKKKKAEEEDDNMAMDILM
eukprot:gene561-957_t